jgi:hypothetical protein
MALSGVFKGSKASKYETAEFAFLKYRIPNPSVERFMVVWTSVSESSYNTGRALPE